MKNKLTNKKIAIFHAFFKARGGAEKFVLQLRDYYQADLFVGAVRTDLFYPENTSDSFSQELFDPRFELIYLHQDGKIPILFHLKRLWYFLYSNQLKKLEKYDLVIFSGNVFFVQSRLKQPKLVTYCHTPPRSFTDQQNIKTSKLPFFLRPFFRLAGKLIMFQYKRDLEKMDLVLSNSNNIQSRLQKYVGLDSRPIYPPVNTHKFLYQSTGDYFLSHSRLEEIKRIPLIVEAFAQMPKKKLVICSSGPLEDWIKKQIETRKLTNIVFEGLVTNERLEHLIGNCLAGIVIPVDEDAGIVQC